MSFWDYLLVIVISAPIGIGAMWLAWTVNNE